MSKGNKSHYLAAIQTAFGSVWIHKDMPPISNNPGLMLVDDQALIQNHQHLGSSMFHEL